VAGEQGAAAEKPRTKEGQINVLLAV